MTCGVYMIINTETGDSYIGSSSDCERRWIEHKKPSRWDYHKNSQMYQYMKLNGVESFTFNIIEECNANELKEKEQQYITDIQPEYNKINALGENQERMKQTSKNYQDKYFGRLCKYGNEIISLNTLAGRFKRRHYKHPTLEAKKYLIGETS